VHAGLWGYPESVRHPPVTDRTVTHALRAAILDLRIPRRFKLAYQARLTKERPIVVISGLPGRYFDGDMPASK
jgi:hypothetical protein